MMFMENQKRKLKRTVTLVKVLAKYGFAELLVRSNIRSLIPAGADDEPEVADVGGTLTVYERIRMVLEELGPTYVKFGQAFSSREDLLPKEMIVELRKLQDRVEPEPLDIRAVFSADLGVDPDVYFERFDEEPFASASISQVYKATLKDGAAVILKVKRSGIREIITADMLIMKDVARLLADYSEFFRKINLVEVLEAFEKSIFQELSFLNELDNIERFARNFKGNDTIYTLKAYPDLSSDDILCMEFVDGIKITDKDSIVAIGLKPEDVVARGLDLFLTQVLDHGFFHADPHPGNLLVLKTGQIAFIDFGTMGSMMPKEKEELEDFISHFMAQDIRRLIDSIKKMSIRFKIADEKKLEKDIQAFFDLLDSTSLDKIEVKELLGKFSAILNDNEILMPEHLYLLVRGIVLIEGIGRTLVPDLNIIESLKPYVLKITLSRLSPEYLKKTGIKLLRTLLYAGKTVPEDLLSIVSKLEKGELKVVQEVQGLPDLKNTLKRGMNRMVLVILLSAVCLSSALLILANQPPMAFVGFAICAVLGIALLISFISDRKQ